MHRSSSGGGESAFKRKTTGPADSGRQSSARQDWCHQFDLTRPGRLPETDEDRALLVTISTTAYPMERSEHYIEMVSNQSVVILC